MATQKIVVDRFLDGLAPSRFQGSPSQFDPYDTTSSGFDPHMQDEEGILRRGFSTTSITNASLNTGTMTWMKPVNRPSGSYVYGIEEQATGSGTNNRLFQINAVSHAITNASPFPHILPSDGGQCGLEFFNGFLYYASTRYLGRYDLSLTFNNCYNIFLGTQAIGRSIDHPMVQGNGKLFIGNSNFSLKTASIATDDGTSVTLNALDLAKTEQFVRSLEWYRNTLLIAGSSNAGTGATTKTFNTMYVWDGISTSYQDKYDFPDEDFHAVRVFRDRVFGFGQRGMYQFNGSGFDLIQPYAGGPDPWGVDISTRGRILWKDELAQLYAYGSPHSGLPVIPYKPIKFSETPAGGVCVVNPSNIYVGGFNTAGSKILRFSTTGTYETGTWKTPMFKFDSPVRLTKFEIVMLPLPSGTTIQAIWASGDGTTDTTIATLSTAATDDWKYQPDGLVSQMWQFGIKHTAGSTPKILRIVLEVEVEKD